MTSSRPCWNTSLLRLSGLLLAVGLWAGNAQAQELDCQVTVESNMVEGVAQSIFQDMKRSMQEFMNNRRWTDDQWKSGERIKCAINVTITEVPRQNFYKATVQVQSSRPVYNTDYNTIVLNYVDQNWEFEYQPSQQMNFNVNNYFNQLTSLLGFYAYMIIGYDYDTFSPKGGTEYFEKAQIILNNALNNGGKGWKAFESSYNRHWLNNDIINQQFEPFRQALYLYHRQGLDLYTKNREKAWENVIQALKNIQKVKKVKPISVVLNNFFDSKNKEIVNLLSEAPSQQRIKAYNMLKELDPTRSDAYEALRQ